MKLKIAILMCLFTIGVPFENKAGSAKQFLDSLPESEKSDFLVFSLEKGYRTMKTNSLQRNINDLSPKTFNIQPELFQKFQTMKTPENFDENLYLYTKDTFKLSQRNMDSLIRSRRICFSRKCINISDIGNMCCPF